MRNTSKIFNIIALFVGLLFMGAGCHTIKRSATETCPKEELAQTSTSTPSIALQQYTNQNLPLSMEIPQNVTVSDCVPKTEHGHSYVDVIGNHAIAPLRIKELPQGVIFYPEWSMEPYGLVHIKTEHDDFDAYTHCKRTPVPSQELVQRDANRSYPYWTIFVDRATSEPEIRASVTRRCYNRLSNMTVYAGLVTTTEPNLFDIRLDVDRNKTNDTSVINCPDLVYAKYESTTHQIYYLFNNGFYSFDDPTHQLIQDNLLKSIIDNKRMVTSTTR